MEKLEFSVVLPGHQYSGRYCKSAP
jgi:hypothetical protein